MSRDWERRALCHREAMEGYTQVHLHEICSYCYALRSTFFFPYWILTPPHGAWESMHFVTHIIIHYPFLSLIKKTLEDENTFHWHWESKITQRISNRLRTLFLMCDAAALLFSRLPEKVKGWTSSHFASLLQRCQDPMTQEKTFLFLFPFETSSETQK